MKLHNFMQQVKAIGKVDAYPASREERDRLLTLLNIQSENFYQEIEMDDPLVQTQEDVSLANDVVNLHSHTYYEIIFIRSGKLQYLIGTQRFRVRRGDILLISPGVSHRPLFLEQLQEPYSRDVIWLSPACADLMQTQWPDLKKLHQLPCMLRTGDLASGCIAAYETAFRAGVREYTTARSGWEAAVFANTLQLLVSLQRDFGSGRFVQPAAEKQDLLDMIMAYTEDHLADHITLESTARQFHISVSTISQLFHRRLGIGYYRYVTQRRLIAAKTYILEGIPLGSIAEAVGFTDYSSFYRAFKQEYGISPTKFKAL